MDANINGIKIIGTPAEFKEFLEHAKPKDLISIKARGRPKRHKKRRKHKFWTKKELDMCFLMNKRGLSEKAIARKLGRSKGSIHACLYNFKTQGYKLKI